LEGLIYPERLISSFSLFMEQNMRRALELSGPSKSAVSSFSFAKLLGLFSIISLLLVLSFPGDLSAAEQTSSKAKKAGAAQAAPAKAGRPKLSSSKVHEELLEKLSQKYGGLVTLKAAYDRKTVTPSTDPIFKNQASQVASGIFYWKKAYSLKVEQTKPAPEDLMTDGTTAWWYVPKEKVVHIYRDLDFQGEFFPLTAFFDGLEELKKHFDISPSQADSVRAGEYGFDLYPLKDDGSYGTITVYCDKDANLTGFKLVSATGEKTDFSLQNPEINPEIKDSFFIYKKKRGVREVEEKEEGV
jgi:outer membrane lipoprotein-sorting protein